MMAIFGYIGATISVMARDSRNGDGYAESIVQNIFSIILSILVIPVICVIQYAHEQKS